jgi:predicted RND superfamily exporter protein
VASGPHPVDAMPVVRELRDFDAESGGRLERLLFQHRPAVLAVAVAATVVLGWAAVARHVVSAGFEEMIPGDHPFVASWLEHRDALRGLGDSLHVVVEATRGDVFDPAYLDVLRRVSDELFLTPGVDRPWVRSLWTPGVRWVEVTEEGFRGGPVMPDDWDGSPRAVAALRRNVERADVVASLVAADGRSSVVFVPLLERDPVSGRAIDLVALSARLEALRARFEGPEGGGLVRLRIVGLAMRVGALVAGTRAMVAWFAVAAAIVAAVLLAATRCLRSTALVVACSATAVVWQVGLVSALGLALDPFTALVPFLVFAMGVSHATQKMNGIMQDVGRGTHRLVAARYTFRRLFAAGLTALLTDAVGFAVLGLVDVPAMRRLAATACIGTAVLVVTSLVLVPVLLSYTGVSAAAAASSLRSERTGASPPVAWRLLERLTGPRWAAAIVAACAAGMAAAWAAGSELAVGDLRPGAPELRASSRYNEDDAYLGAHYGVSHDRFAVILETPPEGVVSHPALVDADRLAWALRQLPGVRTTVSLADAVRQITAASQEGNPRWLTLSRDPAVLNHAALQAATRNPDLLDADGTVTPIVAHLADHRPETLDAVVRTADAFARAHGDGARRFRLAAGNAGLDAARNLVLRDAQVTMTLAVWAAVILLSFAALRSARAVVVTIVPLAAASLACQALMVALGIGVSLSTLPVIALGVGIPDYALYLLSVQLAHQRAGMPLAEAHRRSLRFTGRAVALVAVTLATAVASWALSPIRLQAEMGLLLAFMFLANMAGAFVLVPALSRLLLADESAAADAAPGRLLNR